MQAATYAIDKPYDYLLPPELDGCSVGLPGAGALRTGKPPQRRRMILSLRAGGAGQAAEGGAHAAGRGAALLTEKELRLALWMTPAVFLHVLRRAADGACPRAVWYHYREMWTLVRGMPAGARRLRSSGGMPPLAGRSRAVLTDKLRQALGADVRAAAAAHGQSRCACACRPEISNRKVQRQGGNAGLVWPSAGGGGSAARWRGTVTAPAEAVAFSGCAAARRLCTT